MDGTSHELTTRRVRFDTFAVIFMYEELPLCDEAAAANDEARDTFMRRERLKTSHKGDHDTAGIKDTAREGNQQSMIRRESQAAASPKPVVSAAALPVCPTTDARPNAKNEVPGQDDTQQNAL